MADPTTTDRYLDDVDSYLHVDRTQRERILTEIQGHLHDAVDAHISQGLGTAEAVQRAMAELGTPQEVAAQFSPPLPPSRSVRGWQRWTPMLLPAALLALSAVLSAWVIAGILTRGGPMSMGERTALGALLPYTAVFAALTTATHLAIRKADRDPAWRRAAWLLALLAGAIYAMNLTGTV